MDILKLLSNKALCDLTGNRLWVDSIHKEPGFVSEKNSYITYGSINQSTLFRFSFLEDNEPILLENIEHIWTPAGITETYKSEHLTVLERKYITKEDVIVSVLRMENRDESLHKYKISVPTLLSEVKSHFRSLYNPNYIESENVGGHTVKMQLMVDIMARNVLRSVVDANIVFYSDFFNVSENNHEFFGEVSLFPGETVEISVLGTISHIESGDKFLDKLYRTASEELWVYNEKVVSGWFLKNVPILYCSDKILEKVYYYRWYMVYKNMINPEINYFQHICMYEGKDQFSLVCSASAAMHIREMRWLRDTRYVMSEFKTLKNSQISNGRDKGRLRDLYVSDIPAAIWETAEFLPEVDRQKIVKNRSAVKAYVDYQMSEKYMPKGALLPIVVGSWRTAAEYQPSFFEFTKPKWDHTMSNPFENEHRTQLHRVDDCKYLSENLKAVSALYREADEMEVAGEYGEQAKRIRNNMLDIMWDEKTAFFYDVCPETLEKAWQSKNYAGFLGIGEDLSEKMREELMEHLENEFSAPYPILTVAKDCPAFAPDNTWRVGPNASEENPAYYNCCWNGPSWNFANSLILDALGKSVQQSYTRKQEALFATLFKSWCMEQCRAEDAVPNTCEHYNPYTGEELRKVRDYSHSTFVDIVIRRIVGVTEIKGDILKISPLDIGACSLRVFSIPVKGHLIDFIWDTERMVKLEVYCDGNLVYQNNTLCDFEISLKNS